MNLLKKRENILLVGLAVIVGIAIGLPLGNRTVTKVKTINNTTQLAIGQPLAQATGALNLKVPYVESAGSQQVGTATFQCVRYYGQKDASGNPSDWFAVFCAK